MILSSQGSKFFNREVVKDLIDDKAKAAQREYLRAWRKQNPEKVKQYNRGYWERRAEREAKQDAENASTEQ